MAKQKENVETKHNIVVERTTFVNRGPLMAFVTINIDGLLKINGVKIVKSKPDADDAKELFFVAMPQHKSKDSKYFDTVFISDNDLRNAIQAQVLNQYEKELKKPESAKSR